MIYRRILQLPTSRKREGPRASKAFGARARGPWTSIRDWLRTSCSLFALHPSSYEENQRNQLVRSWREIRQRSFRLNVCPSFRVPLARNRLLFARSAANFVYDKRSICRSIHRTECDQFSGEICVFYRDPISDRRSLPLPAWQKEKCC
jgi:hypothetical protein